MQALKQNAPVLVMAGVMAVLFGLGNFGILLPSQIEAIMALLGIGGGAAMHRMQPPAKKAAETVAKAAILLCLVGCTPSLASTEPARFGASPAPSDYCRSLDSQHRTWGGIGKGSALAAGGAGLSTVATEDKDARTGLAIGSIGAAAIAALAVYISEDAASTRSRDCH